MEEGDKDEDKDKDKDKEDKLAGWSGLSMKGKGKDPVK